VRHQEWRKTKERERERERESKRKRVRGEEMVTALAAQLQQLREGGAGSKQKTPSFLYDPKEASHLDDETIYHMACNGLIELKKMDARFEEFDIENNTNHPSHRSSLLFSRHRIHFHRSQITKQEEIELNQDLTKCLDALSGYFLLNASHKVLEFLVRRYEIHRFNVDQVMACI
jgi:U3 small nucleolar RNA-associated protein 10